MNTSSPMLALISWIVPEARRAEWRREWEAELDHLDRTLRAAGRGPAPRAARRLGHTLDALEDAVGMRRRDRSGWTAGIHVRMAVRALTRSPGFTAVAVLTLGLGIGANTAVFSVVRSVLLRPLPFRAPAELVDVTLSFRNLETGAERPIVASEPEYLETRAADTGLTGLAAFWTTEANLGGGQEPVRVPTAYVTADFLEVLGVAPRLGRGFAEGEDRPGGANVVVLSHGVWTRVFGADPEVVGRDVRLQGRPARVVGVLPPDFVFPGDPVDVLAPNTIDPADPAGRSSHYLAMVGRLAPDVSLAAAQARLDDLAARWGDAFPGRHGVSPGHPVTLVALQEAMVGDLRAALLLLLGAVGLVLVIACANVASLTLVRMEHRQHESGVRVALGGSRSAVVAPFVLESALVAAVGGALGLGVAFATTDLVERLGPDALQRVGGVEVDGPVLLFTGAMALLTTLLSGWVPALLASRGRAAALLRTSARNGSGRDRGRVRRGIVVGEIAVAVVLIVGAGLLLRSFTRLQSVDPGFDADGRVTLRFSLSSGAYPDAARVNAFHEALADRVRALPGVVAYGSVLALPFADRPGVETISPTDRPVDEDDFWNAGYQVVGPGVLEALGVPLVRGRFLGRQDEAAAAGAAVVNETMAGAFWPGEDPVGRTFKHGGPGSPTPELTVVGVVGDVLQDGYTDEVAPTFFVPLAQAAGIYDGLGTRSQSVVVHTSLPAAAALAGVHEAVAALDPGLPVSGASTLQGVMGRSVTEPRFLTVLVGTFSVLALGLGALGVGGLVAYSVACRRRELGLRMALGADAGTILRGVLADAVSLAALGVALGIAASWWATGLLAGQLFDVGPRDPVVFAAAPVLLMGVAALAALVPGRRATTVDPAAAMRSD